ncbi:MAG: LysM peptidoglycan-binding domain-containing protein [Chitinophagales bacterium]
MKKHVALFLFSFAFTHLIIAQNNQLMIKGQGKNLHLDHTVVPKEGIFSIGRVYNVHPKAIAAYNKLDMAKGLSVGQLIHIPLTDTNFTQKNSNGKPIFYDAGSKETLEKVSSVNNKVSLKSLRDWNKLSDDKQAAGKKLIVGFLVSNENGTATVPKAEKNEVTVKDTIAKQPVVKTNTEKAKPVLKDDQKKVEAKKPESVATKPELTPKDTEGKQPDIKTNTELDKTTAKGEQKKEETKKTETPVTRPQTTTDINPQGYFKSSFDQQVRSTPQSKSETVTAGIFRVSNGLQETKYYLLIDGVPSGTIIRVINPDNNKAIYAKVLGEMSGIRQNQGLNIRISNAAASTLDITDTDKFIVKISY